MGTLLSSPSNSIPFNWNAAQKTKFQRQRRSHAFPLFTPLLSWHVSGYDMKIKALLMRLSSSTSQKLGSCRNYRNVGRFDAVMDTTIAWSQVIDSLISASSIFVIVWTIHYWRQCGSRITVLLTTGGNRTQVKSNLTVLKIIWYCQISL